jgi:hypothetical protein
MNQDIIANTISLPLYTRDIIHYSKVLTSSENTIENVKWDNSWYLQFTIHFFYEIKPWYCRSKIPDIRYKISDIDMKKYMIKRNKMPNIYKVK